MSNPREAEGGRLEDQVAQAVDLGDTHAGDDCWRDILDVRTINAINNASILYTNGVKPKMRQIFALSDNELSRLKTMGPVGIRKIREAQRRLQGAPVAEWDVDSLASLLIAFAEDHPQRKVGDAMTEVAKRLRAQKDLNAESMGFARGRCAALHELDLEDHETPCEQCRVRAAEVYADSRRSLGGEPSETGSGDVEGALDDIAKYLCVDLSHCDTHEAEIRALQEVFASRDARIDELEGQLAKARTAEAKAKEFASIWAMYADAAAKALEPLGEAFAFDDPDSLSGAISRLIALRGEDATDLPDDVMARLGMLTWARDECEEREKEARRDRESHNGQPWTDYLAIAKTMMTEVVPLLRQSSVSPRSESTPVGEDE